MFGAQQKDREDQQRQRCRRRQFGFRRKLEQAPDLGGHGVEAGRQRQDRRRTEQSHRLQERDQGAGKQRRQHQRNGDAARGVPAAAAEDRRGVFQFAGRAVERVGDQHEDVRKRVARNNEDDAFKRIDVEDVRVLFGAGDGSIDLVQQAAVRRSQQLPGDGAEKGWRDEGGGDQRADERTKWQIGTCHQPAHWRGHGAADDGR